MPNHSAFLKVHHNCIQNQAGETVILRGPGLGGWMNMENFISGFSANEEAFRQVVLHSLGKEKTDFLFDRYLEYFFQEEDAAFIQSLGLNLVRLPFNYRHFEDDMNPFVLKESGFKHLDRVIELCAKHNLYTILDLHAAPGYQNQDWHSDNPSMEALFWKHKHFQDRAVWLWEKIAERYRGNPWIAGYDLLNEPSDPTGEVIGPFYRRMVGAVRHVDPDHIIFLEGNRYSQDISGLGLPFPNIVYTIHHYPAPGFISGGPYPGVTRGEHFDKSVLHQKVMDACQYMLANQAPIWVGEFGPVYTGSPAQDAMRYQLLEDQISIYQELGASWSIWTYKDIGLQGIVYLSPDSKWVQLIQPVVDKKAVLGVDSWGGLDRHVRHIMDPIDATFSEFFPQYHPFPFDARWKINRSVRHILLAEPINEDFYALLHGLDFGEIDELMASFKFQNCRSREPLCQILKNTQVTAS